MAAPRTSYGPADDPDVPLVPITFPEARLILGLLERTPEDTAEETMDLMESITEKLEQAHPELVR
jgi:hypothetical protein